jgi:hypothetical protein
MMDIIVKIMVEVFLILGIITKEITLSRDPESSRESMSESSTDEVPIIIIMPLVLAAKSLVMRPVPLFYSAPLTLLQSITITPLSTSQRYHRHYGAQSRTAEVRRCKMAQVMQTLGEKMGTRKVGECH